MGLDTVNSNGYQGSNTKVNMKQVQPITYNKTEIASEVGLTEDRVSIDIANADMKRTISEINSKLNKNTEAIFGIHEATNSVTIKIIDKDSKEVIKEIPSEKTLEMIEKIWEIAGILVDKKL